MRYKRGWFHESYRHSLAARGIKTSFADIKTWEIDDYVKTIDKKRRDEKKKVLYKCDVCGTELMQVPTGFEDLSCPACGPGLMVRVNNKRKSYSFAIIKEAGFYYVDPDDFLQETGQPPKGARSKEYIDELKKGVEEKGVERPGVLEFDTSGKLVLHEGRHRAAVSKSVGKKIHVFVDVEGDDTWFYKYFKMYPEDEHLKDSSMGRYLKQGKISAAFAYSDMKHDKKLRKLFGVPDNLVDLGTLH